MNARQRILTAIRGSTGAQRPVAVIAAEAAALLERPEVARPGLAAPELREAFALKAAAVGTTIDHLDRMAEVPAAVRRYLDAQGLPAAVALQPAAALAGLDWGGIATHPDIAPDEAVGVGLAEWGIAEGGSLVIHSGPDNPVLLAFLTLHHVLVLREDRLLPHLEDYALAVQDDPQPRNAILITGPSGTTDIEGSYVRGAHGPGFLHVIMVRDSSDL